jgi:DNA-directed RNA polymerase specialized sigma24 family protein
VNIPRDWLPPDDSPQARYLARLEADEDLVLHLALQGFEGSDFDFFNGELAKYGIGVLTGWMVSGLIFAKVKAPPGDELRDRDIIEELVGETVAKALVHFRQDVLMQRRWTSTRGATLRTFFIGQCLIRFSNVYRSWWAKEMKAARFPLVDPTDAAELSTAGVEGPEPRSLDEQEVARVLARVTDPRVKTALVLAASGWQQWEIARRLQVTEKTVERMLANNRSRLRTLGVVA